MAAAAGAPWFVVALLRRVFALALALAERFAGSGAARRPAGEPAALAELKLLPGAERYRLIEAARLDPRRSEALAEQARRAGAAGEEEMAELAGFLARQGSSPDPGQG